jgi:HAMP domain-containing protein
MSSERASAAIVRIEDALRRIDLAGTRPAPPGAAAGEFSHLATRHDALRAEAQAALGALDSLIADAGGR